MKKIDTCIPFQPFFVDCRYAIVFSAIKTFDIGIFPILADATFLYGFDDTRKSRVKFFSDPLITPLSVKMKQMGITRRTTYVNEHNLVKNIECCIDKGEPIFVNIDIFYTKLKWLPWLVFDKVISKDHASHGILIYGYDSESKVFFILDDGGDGCFTDIMAYEELVEAYIGNTALNNSKDSIIQVYSGLNYQQTGLWQEIAPHCRCFAQNQLNNKSIINENHFLVSSILSNVEDILSSETGFEEYGALRAFTLQCFQLKNAMKYCISQLFPHEHELICLLDRITFHWRIVYMNFNKAFVSNNISESAVTNVYDRIEKIQDLEVQCHAYMFERLVQYA